MPDLVPASPTMGETPRHKAAGLVAELAGRFWFPLVLLATLEGVAAGLALLSPIPLQTAVDVLIERRPAPTWLASLPVPTDRHLVVLAVSSLVLAVANQAQGVASSLLSTRIGQRMIRELRARMFGAALRLSLSRHYSTGVSDTLYRIQSDAQTVEWTLIDGALPVFSAALTLITMVSALFRLDPWLGVVGLAVAPPLLISARIARPQLKTASKAAREKESQALAAIHETLGALPLVKAFCLEGDREAEFRTRSDRAIAAKMRVSLLDGLLGSGVQLLCAMGTALALFVALLSVQQGKLTIGQALMGLHYIGQIYSPLRTLGKKWASLQTQLAGLERALVLLNHEPEVPETPNPLAVGRSQGAIRFAGVTFGYDERRPILTSIDLDIAPGERIAVVGETGSGKSTLLALLLRLYDPLGGIVTLDGNDIRDLRIADLRQQVAVVFQETTLFSGTIAQNIAVGRPGAGDEEIAAAAEAAQLGPALARFPDGLQTQVGERGQSLSGGERQRIGIARALLKNAPILILDEPTSALDKSTEAGILETLGEAMRGRTVLLVTHRETALVGCDRVVRVVDGQMVEQPRA